MIKTGQRAKAEDFIITAQAGQAITAGDAVMVGNGTDSGAVLLQVNSTDNASQLCSGTTWVAQRVRFSTVRNITHIGFKMVTSQSVTQTVRIRASLTGADLATGSFTPGSSNGSIAYRTVALSVAVDLDPDTDYYVIFSGAYTAYGQTTSSYPDGEAYVSTNSGSSWATHGTASDWGVYLVGGITEAGKAYKAIASLPDLFIGFALENANTNNDCLITPQILIRGLLTGLTTGSLYYLSATAGVLATSGTHLIGIAVTATELLRFFRKS